MTCQLCRSTLGWSRLLFLLAFALAIASPRDVVAQTTFTVTKVADTDDGVCDADCSLREAITAANGTPGADTIAFNIPGGGVRTIFTLSALPTITASAAMHPRRAIGLRAAIQIFSTGGVNHPGVDAKTLVAVTSGTTDANGVMAFSLDLSGTQPGVQPGDYLVATATATDVSVIFGQTSEVSDPIAVTAMPRYDISGTVTLNGAPMPFAFLQLAGSFDTGA